MRDLNNAKVRLERNSQRFAKRLFLQFPAWQQYFSYSEQEEGFLIRYLDMQIPAMNPNVSEALSIRAERDEITVSWWGGWHVHFSPSLHDQKPDDYLQSALDFLDRFTSDNYITGNYYRDGKLTGCGFGYGNDHRVSDRMLDPEWGHIVFRSWLGGHDGEAN